MKPQTAILLLLSFSAILKTYGQDEDLLKGLTNEKPHKEKMYGAFKSPRVIMTHSMEMLRPGVFDLRILHRFGLINGGAYQFFGLDAASMRLGFDYGISDELTAGIGRSTFNKELDAFLKYRLIHQSTGPGRLPFSLVAVGGPVLKTLKWSPDSVKHYFTDRLSYYGQLVIGRKFSEAFSFQLVPTIVHRNLVVTKGDKNDVYAVGAGGRIKLTKHVSFNVDYYYVINQKKYYLDKDQSIDLKNPLSIGFDIETGGHVFQLHFTNAVGMNEKAFLTETTDNWGKGDIRFGFNLSRSFQLKKPKDLKEPAKSW